MFTIKIHGTKNTTCFKLSSTTKYNTNNKRILQTLNRETTATTSIVVAVDPQEVHINPMLGKSWISFHSDAHYYLTTLGLVRNYIPPAKKAQAIV